MPNDIGKALAISTATAAASLITFKVITSTAASGKFKNGISLRDLFARRDSVSDNTTYDSVNPSDRRDQLYQAENRSMPTSASDENRSDGSESVYSDDDSDSDISYDDESSRSFKDSLMNLLGNDVSFGDSMISLQGIGGGIYNKDEVDPDGPYDPCIYLDYNGTTPVDRRVFASMIPYLTLHFGNPSSSHAFGVVPKRAIARARRSILAILYPNSSNTIIDADVEKSIIFTGCGTEADNMAIHLALSSTPSRRLRKKHIVTTNVEHPAITECLKVLEAKGEIIVTYVPVNSEGIVSSRDVIKAITSQTVLVTIMLANNESGSLQPVREIGPYCRNRGILFHTDAAQAVGKISIALDERGISDVDMVTIVGHKFGAPKGIACLYIRPGCLSENGRKEPRSFGYGSSGILLHGGGQESGRRAGTENVPYIVGMGQAAEILSAHTSKQKHRRWRKNATKMRSMKSRLLFKFQEAFQDIDNDIVRVNGPKDPTKVLPNTLSVGFRNVHSGELLKNIQTKVACSAGSACHASGGKVSGVLVAMKVPTEYAIGTLRLSVGPSTTIDEVDKAAKIIIDEVKRQLKIPF